MKRIRFDHFKIASNNSSVFAHLIHNLIRFQKLTIFNLNLNFFTNYIVQIHEMLELSHKN